MKGQISILLLQQLLRDVAVSVQLYQWFTQTEVEATGESKILSVLVRREEEEGEFYMVRVHHGEFTMRVSSVMWII